MEIVLKKIQICFEEYDLKLNGKNIQVQVKNNQIEQLNCYKYQ